MSYEINHGIYDIIDIIDHPAFFGYHMSMTYVCIYIYYLIIRMIYVYNMFACVCVSVY